MGSTWSFFDKSDLAAVRKGSKRGFLDRTGRVAVPLEWEDVQPFGSSDLAMVQTKWASGEGKWGMAVDRAGKIVDRCRMG